MTGPAGPPARPPVRPRVGDPLAYLSLAGAVLIWGGSHLAIRVALDSFTPLALAVIRLVLAAACLAFYARWAGETLAVPRRDVLPLLGLGVLSHTVFQFLINAALLYTTPAHAALMVSTMPTFAALGARGLLGERVTPRRAGAILMAFAGVAVVILWSGQGLATARHPVLGDLLALGTAAAWAVGSVLSKPFLGRYSALKFSAVTLAAGALSALPFGAAAVARTSWEGVTGTGWLMLPYLTVGSIALANSLWNRGIAGVEVSQAAVFSNLIPVTTLGLSALLLGERITLPLLGGGALVVIGTYLTQRT